MGNLGILFPERISRGSRMGAGYQTVVTESDSGFEARSSTWGSQTGSLLTGTSRVTVDVAESVKSRRDIAEIRDFWWATRGGQCGFRFRDWTDWATGLNGSETPANTPNTGSLIGVANGVNTRFQLVKNYTGGGGSYQRVITKPMRPTDPDFFFDVWFMVGGSFFRAIDVGHVYNLDYDTGILRFNNPPLYFQGIPVPNTLVIAHFTFHVPAFFGPDADQFLNMAEEDGAHSIDTLPIVEINPDAFYGDEERNHGGASTYDMSGQPPTFEISRDTWLQNGAVHRFVNISGLLDLILPDPGDFAVFPSGGPWMVIWNHSVDGSAAIRLSQKLFGSVTPVFGASSTTQVVIGQYQSLTLYYVSGFGWVIG